jgi:hypothetical protein
MTQLRLTLICFFAAVWCGQAVAQPVWRCGTDGNLFSDRPCSDGQRYAASDNRSAEEVRGARELASREQKLAMALESERLARNDVAPGSGLMRIGPTAEEREREIRRLQRLQRQQLQRQKLQSQSNARTSPAIDRASRRDLD